MMSRIAKVRSARPQRGAVAVIISVSLLAILGSTGLAVDLGNQRATNGRTTTAADAAALAAAYELTNGATETAACAAAATQVAANEPAATLHSCTSGTASSGQTIVTVEVREIVDYVFAQVLGFSSGTVSSVTSTRWGIEGVGGARPFGTCIEALDGLLGGWDPLGISSIGPIQVPYGKSAQPAACNGGDPVPGNWGTLDFNGGSNGTPDQLDWIENGYNGTIYPGDWIEGNPGAMSNSVATALDALIASGEVFAVPIFGSVCCGNGANAEFGIVGFVNTQLTDYDVTGSAASRWLEFVFHPGLLPGLPCCDIGGTPIVLTASGICATDEDTAAC